MKKTAGISVILFLLLIPMLFHADYVTEGARHGLLLWYNSVVPALFPFMVLSGLIVSGGGIPLIMAPFYKILHPLFGISENGCYVLISGLLCGCPMGAKTCADFVNEGRISLAEGKFLLAICNHPSPMFILGYMYSFFAHEFEIWELLICVYLPVILLAILAKIIYFSKPEESVFGRTDNQSQATGCLSIDNTILSAVEILCKIGGYLVLFSILIIFIKNTPQIPTPVRIFTTGLLEMTTGIRELTESLNSEHAWIFSIAALTFGGFSGIFQTNAVLSPHTSDNEKKAGLSIRPYFLWKLAHAVCSAGLAYFICIKR